MSFCACRGLIGDIQGWEKIILFLSETDWIEWIFRILFLLFLAILVAQVWPVRLGRVAARREICDDINAKVVADILTETLAVFSDAYDHILIAHGLKEEEPKASNLEMSDHSKRRISPLIFRAAGYVEGEFSISLKKWAAGSLVILIQLRRGSGYIAPQIVSDATTQRSQMLSWIETLKHGVPQQ